jgi:cellulose synthase/poly-beta-1,6-N-acetylglucosamine synthase-like glycosyltransferase
MTEVQWFLLSASALALLAYARWVSRTIQRSGGEASDAAHALAALNGLTVLIPCRNEAQRLPDLLHDLRAQSHPVRILVIDDASSDGTADVARRAGVTCIPAHGTGKKAALATGFAEVETPWFATVDADVRLGADWAQTLLTEALAHGAACVLGSVAMDGEASAFERFQRLEFAVMQGWISGGVQAGRLAMGSGANSLYRTADYPVHELEPRYASGDDAFALKALRERGQSIRWCGNPAARVTTAPAPNWKSLWQQRARWASKTGGQDRETRTTALTVAAVHIAGLTLLVHAAWCGTGDSLVALCGFWALKGLADVPLLRRASREFGWPLRAMDILTFSLRYAVLVWGAWWQLLFASVHWKGRRI